MARSPEEVYEKYLELTGEALDKVQIPHAVESAERRNAEDFLDMAQRYYEDAQHFHSEGMIAEALAAVSYAHGWLDAGARIGLFNVQGDSRLFTVD